MSRTNARDAEPTLRGEIVYLLQHRLPDFERGENVATAWTVKAIADEIDASVEDVQSELSTMQTEGVVTTRRPRTGHVLYKLTDSNHDKWQAFSGPNFR
jgi:hypothetical protein